jgi:ArsR family transcriptional regulator
LLVLGRGLLVQRLNQIFKALSDETRLRIVNLLTTGELCVCDIMSILDISQPKASRHLAYLKYSGLVESRREGLWMHYSLKSDLDKGILALIDLIVQWRKKYSILQQDILKLTMRLNEKSLGKKC